VLSVQVIEHLLAPEQGLAELARVLRPRGRLVLSTDNARNHVSKLLNLPRTTVVHSLRLGGRRRRVAFPHRAFTVGEVEALVAGSGLVVEHLETFRFHLDPPFDRRSLMTLANTADRRLPPHGFGDLIAVIASKPGGRLQTK
jgi:SAM-dependent methyltransferase